MAEATQLTLSRLIALSDFLVANPGTSVKDVARHFGRTPRQVRRDVSFLAEAGFGDLLPGNLLEIDAAAFEQDGVLVLHDPLGLDQAPTVTDEELALVLYGLRVLAPELGEEDGPVVASALKKLLDLAGRGEESATPQLDTVSLLENTDKLAVLRKAIAQRTGVEIDYVRGDGQRGLRDVFPLTLTFESHGWVLGAVLAGTFERRSFRVDRMASVHPNTKRRPSDRTLLGYREQPIDAQMVTVELDQGASWLVKEVPASQVQVSDTGIEVTFTVWDPAWIRTELLALADYVQGVDPKDVCQDAGRFARDALDVWEAVLEFPQTGTDERVAIADE